MLCNTRRNAAKQCQHGRDGSSCAECGGSSRCTLHNKTKSTCKDCHATGISVAGICEHGRVRRTCIECDGSHICEHKRERRHCQTCDPVSELAYTVGKRTNYKLKATNPKLDIIEHVGCDIGQLRVHLEALFDLDMTWENYGEWHIDHMIAITAPNADGSPVTREDLIPRLHWTNLQPLWVKDNMAKGNR